MAESLDTLGVSAEHREHAKIMWLLTIFLGLGGSIICAFLWTTPGQDQNQWFQYQLKQGLYVGILAIIANVVCFGWLVALVIGVMGFLAIDKGEDFEVPVIGGMCR